MFNNIFAEIFAYASTIDYNVSILYIYTDGKSIHFNWKYFLVVVSIFFRDTKWDKKRRMLLKDIS